MHDANLLGVLLALQLSFLLCLSNPRILMVLVNAGCFTHKEDFIFERHERGGDDAVRHFLSGRICANNT